MPVGMTERAGCSNRRGRSWPCTVAVAILAIAAPIAAGPGTATAQADPGMSIRDRAVDEGLEGMTKRMRFDVTLSEPSAETVTATWATEDGTAVAPDDYQAASGHVRFKPGQMTKYVYVSAVGDALDEPKERYFVELDSPINATIDDGIATGTIRDDDPAPVVSVTDAVENEGFAPTTLNFRFKLSAPSGRTTKISYATVEETATAGVDFVSKSRTLTIPPGVQLRTHGVSVNPDGEPEPDETMGVVLSQPSNLTIGDGMATGSILNDDGPLSVPLGVIHPVDVLDDPDTGQLADLDGDTLVDIVSVESKKAPSPGGSRDRPISGRATRSPAASPSWRGSTWPTSTGTELRRSWSPIRWPVRSPFWTPSPGIRPVRGPAPS